MSIHEKNRPELSVIITVVDAGVTLERCLKALAAQTNPPPAMEVLVPYDHITRGVKIFEEKFPNFTFIDLGEILNGMVPKNAFEEHKFYDARRSAALKMARGHLVSMLEDRGVPAQNWAATMVELHEASADCAAIGGAIENGVNKRLNWAVFICDFGRYQPPLSNHNPEFVSDTNICYKRKPLEVVRELWSEQRFDEAQVNWALQRNGEKLLLSDKPRTTQIREPTRIGKMVYERYHWGCNFGQSRSHKLSRKARLLLCLGTPALPLYLYVRHFWRQLSKGHVGQFILASPALLLLLLVWTMGEFMGYVKGTPDDRFSL